MTVLCTETRRAGTFVGRLTAIRQRSDWEGWTRFFLRGVGETATEATARAILELRERHRAVVGKRTGLNGMRLLDLLFDRPLVNVNLVKNNLDVAFQTANSPVGEFEEARVLAEITGGKTGRVFRRDPDLALLQDDAPARSGAGDLLATEPRDVRKPSSPGSRITAR